MELHRVKLLAEHLSEVMGYPESQRTRFPNCWPVTHDDEAGFLILRGSTTEDATLAAVFELCSAPNRNREHFFRRLLGFNLECNAGVTLAYNSDNEKVFCIRSMFVSWLSDPNQISGMAAITGGMTASFRRDLQSENLLYEF